MKKKIKILCAMLIVLILGLVICGCASKDVAKVDFLRIHIRADSNDEIDQTVKLKVRDGVVALLSPLLKSAADVRDAEQIVTTNIPSILQTANRILIDNGFSYRARANVRNERFPARTYGELSLDGGIYRALIVELGNGTGDNWWCVAYPPLCFIGEETGTDEYKSFLWETIQKWRKK